MSVSKIKISVITVVYNGERCIEKTMLSLFQQSYRNFEYIVIDGKSNDRTIKICDIYNDQISKIISERDLGLYDAMNKGIDCADGDYVIFMNCGDAFSDSFVLEKMVENILKNQYPDFIYGDSYEDDDDGIYYKKARSHRWLWYGMFTHHQAMIYKLNIIKSNNIKYNIDYKISADYAFTAEYFKFCNSYLYLNSAICFFNRGGISSQNYGKTFDELSIIKLKILKLSPIQVLLIIILQKLVLKFKIKFTKIYNYFRYSSS